MYINVHWVSLVYCEFVILSCPVLLCWNKHHFHTGIIKVLICQSIATGFVYQAC